MSIVLAPEKESAMRQARQIHAHEAHAVAPTELHVDIPHFGRFATVRTAVVVRQFNDNLHAVSVAQ